MKIVTRYEALDGKIFENLKDCLMYDALILQCKALLDELNPIPEDDTCGFSNGGGFIQQDQKVINKITKELKRIAINEGIITKDNLSYLGRILSDNYVSYKPLFLVWSRLQQIDPMSREWGQPYFANNPSEGVQKEYTATNET